MQKEHPATMFKNLIIALEKQEQVVVIIDEYDKPMINQLHDIAALNEFRAFFKEFYGALKDCGQYLRFLFITGVSQFQMVSVFSDLNHIDNLSTTELAATLCGYTQSELEATFQPYLLPLAEKEALSYHDLLKKVKTWYNGYYFATPNKLAQTVYSPFSILKLCKHAEFKKYWFTSGTPSFVIEYFKNHQFMPVDFEKVAATAERLETFVPEKPDLTTMLYQTGYLTIQSYDSDSSMYTLAFPNFEVASACSAQLFMHQTTLSESILHTACTKLRNAFAAGNTSDIKPILTTILSQIPYPIRPNIGADYQAIFYIMLNALGLPAIIEDMTAICRTDVTIKAPATIYILEFKISGTAQTALKQIKDKRYAEKYAPEGLPIVLMGVVFNPKKGTITGVVTEKWKKRTSPMRKTPVKTAKRPTKKSA